MKTLKKIAVAGASFAVAGAASAGTIDTASVTAALTEAGTAAGVVGAAVLVVVVGIKAFKFIKQAL
jgi:hypothetical protein